MIRTDDLRIAQTQPLITPAVLCEELPHGDAGAVLVNSSRRTIEAILRSSGNPRCSLVLRGGRAVFTQPSMPIECAGAPQQAMYLSADHWRRTGVLSQLDIRSCNAGAVLFGVPDYVPALMEYVGAYGIGLEFNRVSLLADAVGRVDVDPATLRHRGSDNVFALGDAGNTTNAKTAAAARKQAPVVAHNLPVTRGEARGDARYDGYGSCPLTVERGKIVLAEFTHGGKLAPSFPGWLIDGKRPSRLAWNLKERILPPLYWDAMLKGREWMAKPEMVG